MNRAALGRAGSNRNGRERDECGAAAGSVNAGALRIASPMRRGRRSVAAVAPLFLQFLRHRFGAEHGQVADVLARLGAIAGPAAAEHSADALDGRRDRTRRLHAEALRALPRQRRRTAGEGLGYGRRRVPGRAWRG
ncbi:hypothetical protein CATMIT_01807, partial [Catenibacterium mitsuokai DSM 15897]